MAHLTPCGRISLQSRTVFSSSRANSVRRSDPLPLGDIPHDAKRADCGIHFVSCGVKETDWDGDDGIELVWIR